MAKTLMNGTFIEVFLVRLIGIELNPAPFPIRTTTRNRRFSAGAGSWDFPSPLSPTAMSLGRGVLLLSDPPLGGYAEIGAGGEDPEASGDASPKKQHRRILCPGNDGTPFRSGDGGGHRMLYGYLHPAVYSHPESRLESGRSARGDSRPPAAGGKL